MDTRTMIAVNIIQTQNGKKYRVAADRNTMGWDIGIYSGASTESDSDAPNLLYGGKNFHGIQPWMIYAWTHNKQMYTDARIVGYGAERLKIELIDSAVEMKNEKPVWSHASVKVYYCEP